MSFWTNKPEWYKDAALDGKKILLWHEVSYKPFEHFTSLPAWNAAEKIFIIGQEADFIDLPLTDHRIHVWDSAITEHPRCYPYYFWWHQTKEVDRYLNHKNNLIDPLADNPKKIFDFLVRSMNPQRQIVADLIKKHNHEEYILGTSSQWVLGSDIESTSAHSIDDYSINYHGKQTANNSSILPYKIYNQSWFSIVTESNHGAPNTKRFLSEKTAKCLLGKRMFVFFGPRNCLRDLEQLGYKTFDDIIDQSYDSIEDDSVRWQKAFDQVKYICQCNPGALYRKILPKLEHNQQLFMRQDWQTSMLQEMKQIGAT